MCSASVVRVLTSNGLTVRGPRRFVRVERVIDCYAPLYFPIDIKASAYDLNELC